ncbi:LuxR C-terminal-related transcriptional regulator [Methylibium petroleiphilum]|jgi:LuxR family maltose regulon positive regulatory protein|uniref:LuxR C-terminal-related transcriptional regulator n=1 Tax=Methylibium petroleiphilum TaxID=105560 RepID=UPI0023530AF8|nr:LuxR C-terminal-related transcriptional regulator [Methylibium petroleiphilum]
MSKTGHSDAGIRRSKPADIPDPIVAAPDGSARPQPGAVHASMEVSTHKLFAPPIYPGAVRRRVILDRVLQDNSLRVTVLQGPAGHGKSTTLQQIKTAHEARGWRTAWLTLDDADNDPRRFESHMRALVGLMRDRAAHPEAIASRVGEAPPDLANWMLDALSGMDTHASIFLDEFQALRNEAILRFFRFLLSRLPAHAHVFIGSRSLPEIGLATLLVNRMATVLRADDLRFTPGEVTQFFAESKDLRVSAEEVGAIYRRTEGWPAGLQLFRLGLGSPEVRTSLVDPEDHGPRELAEYLTDNVVTLQSPRIQEFLFKTSLLRRLSAPLCAAVTGLDDAQDILEQLERSGLFVRALDSDNRWFKYHGLFSSFLADSLHRSSELEVVSVHERAARWYLAQHLPEEAIYHALSCRNFSLAAAILSEWSSRLISNAELITLERWYDRLPFDHVANRPVLAIKAAYSLMFLRRRAKLRPLVDLMDQHAGCGDILQTTSPDLCRAMARLLFEDDLHAALAIIDRPEVLQQEVSGFPAFELGAACNVLSFGRIAAGDFEGARKSLMQARAHSERGAGSFVMGYTSALSGARLIVQGKLHEAIERYRADMLAQHAPLDKSFAPAVMAAAQIWALYEANDLAALEPLCAQFQRGISECVTLDFIALAYLSISRMHDARGRSAEAQEVLDELERMGHDSHLDRLVSQADWERVRRAVLAGELDRATALAQRIAPVCPPLDPHWIYMADDMEGEGFGRIRLAIAHHDHALASQLIARERARQTGRVYRDIRLHVFEALLLNDKGSPNGAHRSLRKALQLARPGRYVRCFLDEGRAIVSMLREEYQHFLQSADEGQAAPDPDRDFIELLLAASGTDLGQPRCRHHLTDPLSEREKEMLQFLANGVANKEIASRLFVSENTVKFHLKNIYSKLGVSGRVQAINAARTLRLVP